MTPERPAPRVFLSHASADKDRFVRRFAEALTARGLRVWFDEWALLPGDSLVDKIFAEGLKDADVFIVVISAGSIESRWVREELNAAVVKKIEGTTTLIPVVIDDVEVPEVLRHTVWQRVENVNDFGGELDRILRAIFDERGELTSGSAPAFAALDALPGLHATDTRMLFRSGGLALESDRTLLDSQRVLDSLKGR